jgi:hypothetical protein
MPAPILPEIIRQHAEEAAFLWTLYDRALLYPEENPEMDELRIGRVIERLEANLDGLRIAGPEGLRIAQERYAEFPEPGELFVVRMLTAKEAIPVRELDLARVRTYLKVNESR